MKAIVLEAPDQIVYKDVPKNNLLDTNSVLVRPRVVGICGTDYHAYRGKQPFINYPLVIGHELGVEILEVGSDVTHLVPGDACAVEPYISCNEQDGNLCFSCRRGHTNHCTRLKVLGVHIDGGLCEQFVVPSSKLHLSAKLDYEQLALIETLAIGYHAVKRSGISKNDVVLVVGAGPIGLSVIQSVNLIGAQVWVLDINAKRVQFAKKHFGVQTTFVDPIMVEKERESDSSDEMPTAVFDATGNTKSMESSLNYAASGGKITLVGFNRESITISDEYFHRSELSLIASRNALSDDFTDLIKLMEDGIIDTSHWISERANWNSLVKTLPIWCDSTELIKGVVDIT
jgi:hypothetical protein